MRLPSRKQIEALKALGIKEIEVTEHGYRIVFKDVEAIPVALPAIIPETQDSKDKSKDTIDPKIRDMATLLWST